jgi:glycine/D-amino acid oxidase-like deaminating enzyme
MEKDNKITNIPETCEVVIVGGGVAGSAAAYHLTNAGVKDIIVLECGTPGHGRTEKICLHKELADLSLDHIDQEKEFHHGLRSGSSVMSVATTVKIMMQMYFSTTDEFIKHHGKDGVKKYLTITNRGIKIQKEIAKKLLPDPENQIRQLGSLYVAVKEEEDEIKEELAKIKEFGIENAEWWDKEKLKEVGGLPEIYHCGIHFPDDAVIDSSTYAQCLLDSSVKSGSTKLFTGCSPVISAKTIDGKGVVVLEDGTKITCKHIVLATGGLFTGDPTLSGIMRPCWSFLVSLPHPELSQEGHDPNSKTFSDGTPKCSKNFFDWRFINDWCWTNGAIRISGEDHYSAFKPPRVNERTENLAKWLQKQYPNIWGNKELKYETQYGIYAETPDLVPIVGHTNADSKVCYLLGCNGWGQAVLSYLSTLIPGILGYTELTEEQKFCFSLTTIQRFSLLPQVRNGTI